MSSRIPLYYTFGNHHHWVDMEWLWGYRVTPDSIRDMLKFCRETDAKGNINFEGVGYEKVAAEAPDALEELRQAIREGTVDPVGCSYGQPYGLFHGPESNVRQRIYGVRAAMKVLGTRPTAFWEEEFDFFPQLPQILKGAGFQYASLYFQWTWHTPEVPREAFPVVWWEGADGSRLLCATRNRLNLHQWPEDFQILLDELAAEGPDEVLKRGASKGFVDDGRHGTTPLVLQWLELIPSPDWMCRAELMIPKLQELSRDERFEVRFETLAGYLGAIQKEAAPDAIPVRAYTLDHVWHGMSLGKNGDNTRRTSRALEDDLLAAETLSSLLGLFKRPYAQWDVYPTWELEEAWRELLQAQHHDNDECEGLCGHVGKFSYDRSRSLVDHVFDRSLELLAQRVSAREGDCVLYNPLGWERTGTIPDPQGDGLLVTPKLPAMGYLAIDPERLPERPSPWRKRGEGAVGALGSWRVEIDEDGRIVQISNPAWPNGILADGKPLLDFSMVLDGETVEFEFDGLSIHESSSQLALHYVLDDGGELLVGLELDPDEGLTISLVGSELPRPDGGLKASLQTGFRMAGGVPTLKVDYPYGLQIVQPRRKGFKKYPSGDWMTSPQWFETVENAFTSQSIVDLLSTDGESGLLILHDGSQQWFLDGDLAKCVLTMYDPWDEDFFVDELEATFRLVPHGPMDDAERWRRAQELSRPIEHEVKLTPGGDLPGTFSIASCESKSVIITALYREMDEAGDRLPTYAAKGTEYPYVMRLAEWNGERSKALVTVAGPVARAWRTNLMGELVEELQPRRGKKGAKAKPNVEEWEFEIELGPREIATVYLDIVPGKKELRDLDAHRKVWATVHRIEED